MAKKSEAKKESKPKDTIYSITKSNGNIIERTNLSAEYIKSYESRGWTVNEKGGK